MEIDSRKEKDEQYKKTGVIERWLFIGELKKLIKDLPDDYWVACNEIGHLAINRLTENEEVEFYGIVDFHWNQVDTFGRDPVTKDKTDDKTEI